jgi:hypothetical protein
MAERLTGSPGLVEAGVCVVVLISEEDGYGFALEPRINFALRDPCHNIVGYCNSIATIGRMDSPESRECAGYALLYR